MSDVIYDNWNNRSLAFGLLNHNESVTNCSYMNGVILKIYTKIVVIRERTHCCIVLLSKCGLHVLLLYMYYIATKCSMLN